MVAGQASGGHQPSSWPHPFQAVPGKVGLGRVVRGCGSRVVGGVTEPQITASKPRGGGARRVSFSKQSTNCACVGSSLIGSDGCLRF